MKRKSPMGLQQYIQKPNKVSLGLIMKKMRGTLKSWNLMKFAPGILFEDLNNPNRVLETLCL